MSDGRQPLGAPAPAPSAGRAVLLARRWPLLCVMSSAMVAHSTTSATPTSDSTVVAAETAIDKRVIGNCVLVPPLYKIDTFFFVFFCSGQCKGVHARFFLRRCHF